MNDMPVANDVKIVEIIEGDMTAPSGFVAEYKGVRRVYITEEYELLMDRAKEIGYATDRHFTQVLPLLLEQHLAQKSLH